MRSRWPSGKTCKQGMPRNSGGTQIFNRTWLGVCARVTILNQSAAGIRRRENSDCFLNFLQQAKVHLELHRVFLVREDFQDSHMEYTRGLDRQLLVTSSLSWRKADTTAMPFNAKLGLKHSSHPSSIRCRSVAVAMGAF